MIEEKFDAIVVGAGMAGNACALTLARRGLKVLQLERGEYSGSKNVQGAILYADMLEKLIPDFRFCSCRHHHGCNPAIAGADRGISRASVAAFT